MTEQTEAIVEARARKICVQFGADPDEITDPFGPILRWHEPAYHIDEAIAAAVIARHLPQPSLQSRVEPWMQACFGAEIASDTLERTDRFIEEALELAQTNPAFTADRARALVDYVFGRPVGETTQEVGGVMVTLAALCLANGLDMHEAGEIELARIWTKVDAIRAKQAAKPTGSALPIPQPSGEGLTISEPDMTGSFIGDIWFGHPEKRTLGTHRWNGKEWERLGDEADAVLVLLAKEKRLTEAQATRITNLEADNASLRADDLEWRNLAIRDNKRIVKLESVVRMLADFDARNSIVHLRDLARAALQHKDMTDGK